MSNVLGIYGVSVSNCSMYCLFVGADLCVVFGNGRFRELSTARRMGCQKHVQRGRFKNVFEKSVPISVFEKGVPKMCSKKAVQKCVHKMRFKKLLIGKIWTRCMFAH